MIIWHSAMTSPKGSDTLIWVLQNDRQLKRNDPHSKKNVVISFTLQFIIVL